MLLASVSVAGEEKPGKGARPAGAVKLAAAAKPPKLAGTRSKNPAAAASWKRVTAPVIEAYFARHPDLALARAWPEAKNLALATHGVGATLRWRESLHDGLTGLSRLDTRGMGRMGLALEERLSDWLEAELLLLDAQSVSTADPSAYVRRAGRVLRAADEALWLAPEERQQHLADLLAELPAYFRDARVSLIAPSPLSIDLALRDLEDLEVLVAGFDRGRPSTPETPARPQEPEARKTGAKVGKPGAAARPELTPRTALESFERWLLELRPAAGGRTPRLNAGEWQRLVRLASGTEWNLRELKASCLRELARLDLAARSSAPRRRKFGSDALALRVASASSAALKIAQAARLLPASLAPKGVEFVLEESARTACGLALLRSGTDTSVRVCLQLPHRAWSPDLVATRQASLGTNQQAALGIRYGLTGEALLARVSQKDRGAPPMLLENPLLRMGLGLFALDWIARIDKTQNAFGDDAEFLAELEFQRGYEAARLLAALELHAEGLSLDESVLGFRRRTGVDEATARAEAFAAQRDPLHGAGYLGYLDLRALEQRLAELTNARKATRLALLLVQRNPELRAADLVRALPSAKPSRR